MEWLVARGIFGLGEKLDQVREGKVGEGKWGYQQKRQCVAVGRNNMNEVEPEGCLRSRDWYGCPKLRSLVEGFLLSPPGVLLKPVVLSARSRPPVSRSDSPEIDERLYLSLGLPPLIGRGFCALVRKASEFELLSRQVEISARDLSTVVSRSH